MTEVKTNKKDVWFRAKFYGFGWTPCTWQGWACLLFYLAFLGMGFWDSGQTGANPELLRLKNFAPTFLFSTLILVTVCYFKGEPLRWRWGAKGKNITKRLRD